MNYFLLVKSVHSDMWLVKIILTRNFTNRNFLLNISRYAILFWCLVIWKRIVSIFPCYRPNVGQLLLSAEEVTVHLLQRTWLEIMVFFLLKIGHVYSGEIERAFIFFPPLTVFCKCVLGCTFQRSTCSICVAQKVATFDSSSLNGSPFDWLKSSPLSTSTFDWLKWFLAEQFRGKN